VGNATTTVLDSSYYISAAGKVPDGLTPIDFSPCSRPRQHNRVEGMAETAGNDYRVDFVEFPGGIPPVRAAELSAIHVDPLFLGRLHEAGDYQPVHTVSAAL